MWRLCICSVTIDPSCHRSLVRYTERLTDNTDFSGMRINRDNGSLFLLSVFASDICKHYILNLIFRYNCGRISEEFEILCQKLQERYVGSETTSSCNIWFNYDISNKVSNITRQHRSAGHSPGRRLSHLARRRQTFCCANLLSNGVTDSRHSAAAERRLIMVEIKWVPLGTWFYNEWHRGTVCTWSVCHLMYIGSVVVDHPFWGTIHCQNQIESSWQLICHKHIES